MNEVAENTIPPTENLRSPFTLNKIEILLVVIVALATWFGLRSYIQSTLIWPCGFTFQEPLYDFCREDQGETWQIYGYPLFSTYSIPIVIFMALSSVSLLRCVRKDVRDISVSGNLAMSWPIIVIPGFLLLWYFIFYCFPIGLVLPIFATIQSGIEKRYKYNWISLAYYVVWMVVFGMFANTFINTYGD